MDFMDNKHDTFLSSRVGNSGDFSVIVFFCFKMDYATSMSLLIYKYILYVTHFVFPDDPI